MQLKSQVTVQFPLGSEAARKLFYETENFHDSDLNYVISTRHSHMEIGIRILHWYFLNDCREVDQLSSLHFKLAKPVFLQNWGNDEEICRCIIYDFLMNGDSFNLLTGDGGRVGTFSSEGSHVTFVTTPEILEQLKLL